MTIESFTIRLPSQSTLCYGLSLGTASRVSPFWRSHASGSDRLGPDGSHLLLFLVITGGFPLPISQHGQAYDAQFNATLWVTGIIFFLAQFALGYVISSSGIDGGTAQLFARQQRAGSRLDLGHGAAVYWPGARRDADLGGRAFRRGARRRHCRSKFWPNSSPGPSATLVRTASSAAPI